jgi:hypothetical protein
LDGNDLSELTAETRPHLRREESDGVRGVLTKMSERVRPLPPNSAFAERPSCAELRNLFRTPLVRGRAPRCAEAARKSVCCGDSLSGEPETIACREQRAVLQRRQIRRTRRKCFSAAAACRSRSCDQSSRTWLSCATRV